MEHQYHQKLFIFIFLFFFFSLIQVSSLLADELFWVLFEERSFESARSREQALSVRVEELRTRTLQRRAKVMSGLLVTEADLPISPDYIEVIRASGITIRQQSRWLNAVSCSLSKRQKNLLKEHSFVKAILPLGLHKRKEPQTTHLPLPRKAATPFAFDLVYDYGESYSQVQQLNVPAAHYLGFTGSNVLICLIDTGFRISHESLRDRVVIGEWDFINNDGFTGNEPGDPSLQHRHGTATFSNCGGFAEGILIGPAFNAAFLLAKTENTAEEMPIEEDNWVAALEWAEERGADIVSSSLGYLTFQDGSGYSYEDLDGETAVTSIAASMAAERGVLVVNSAGNEGPGIGSISAPADAIDIITCGAIDFEKNIANFSSRGPTADGRTKPEIVAHGVQNTCADATSDSSFAFMNGTSFSAPLIAGIAALVLEANPSFTPYQIREALLNASDRHEHPDNSYGWGLPDVIAAMFTFSRDTNPTDTDESGRVDGLDLITFSRYFGLENGDAEYDPTLDINNDGHIDDFDVKILTIYFGTSTIPP